MKNTKNDKMLKGAEIVARCLEKIGVEVVFAYPGGQTIELRAEPREDAAVSGKITKAEVTVRPLDMNEDGEWVKVSWNGQTGWIDSYWLCANPLTTCP